MQGEEELYVETKCYMQNEELCVKKPLNNCTEVIETNIKRGCFEVNELVGEFVEAIHYKILEENYQVQRCLTGKGKVCSLIPITFHGIFFTKRSTTSEVEYLKEIMREIIN